MIAPFTYISRPARVIFGDGTLARLSDEVDLLGLKRVLVLATAQQESEAHALAQRLGPRAAGVFAGAVMHTPVNVTEAAMNVVARDGIDGTIAIGGGSTIGLGKAIAYRTDLPQIVIPTTYAGSEMTPILGETADGAKVTRSDARILPEVVIYDVALTMTLPRALSGTSGINAIAHAVEALYAQNANPVISMMALDAIGALYRALPKIAVDPDDRAARSEALYGAWLCGTCLGAVGMSIHHKLCHTLGGSYNLPHAETHTVVLPHALAYNAPAIPDIMARISHTLGGGDAPTRLFELAGRVGAARSLSALGMAEDRIDDAADRALANAYPNPRPLDREPIRDLLARAWSGAPPSLA